MVVKGEKGLLTLKQKNITFDRHYGRGLCTFEFIFNFVAVCIQVNEKSHTKHCSHGSVLLLIVFFFCLNPVLVLHQAMTDPSLAS